MTFLDFFNNNEEPKFLKAGIYGAAGTGKSRTAFEIVKGLIDDKGLVRKVVYFDTERGSDWLLPLFKQANIECYVKKSRSFKELMQSCWLTQKSDVPVIIVDSVSHVWRELCESFRKQYNEDRKNNLTQRYGEQWVKANFKESHTLEFQHWGRIKPMWAMFTDLFLNASLHMIVCGRAGDVYKYEKNDNGKNELVNVGTKMATEKELSYEPSLLIEMRRKYIDSKEHLFGYVEKDRSDTINGMEFELPKYENFKPHIDFLSIGNQITTEMTDNASMELFEGKTLEPEDEFAAEKRKRTIKWEEVKGLLSMKVPGQSAEAKQRRSELLQTVFGTVSETAIEGMHSEKLEVGLNKLRIMLAEE